MRVHGGVHPDRRRARGESGRTDILFLGSAPAGDGPAPRIQGPDIDTLAPSEREVTGRVPLRCPAPGRRTQRLGKRGPQAARRGRSGARAAGRRDQRGRSRGRSRRSSTARTLTTVPGGRALDPVAIRARPEADRPAASTGSAHRSRCCRLRRPVRRFRCCRSPTSTVGRRAEPDSSASTRSARDDVAGEAPGHDRRGAVRGDASNPRSRPSRYRRATTVEIDGEIKEAQESNEKLFAFAPHALFAILLLLVLQFNSFRRPAIILLTIPLVLIGANYGLLRLPRRSSTSPRCSGCSAWPASSSTTASC